MEKAIARCTKCGKEIAPEEKFCGECGAPRPEPVQDQQPGQIHGAERPMDARFRKVEERYHLLKGEVASGRLTASQFETALKQLMIQDSQDRYWMIGAESGQWYRSEGQEWVRAEPPQAEQATTPQWIQTCVVSLFSPARGVTRWKWIAAGTAVLAVIVCSGLFLGMLWLNSTPAHSPVVAVVVPATRTSESLGVQPTQSVAFPSPRVTPLPRPIALPVSTEPMPTLPVNAPVPTSLQPTGSAVSTESMATLPVNTPVPTTLPTMVPSRTPTRSPTPLGGGGRIAFSASSGKGSEYHVAEVHIVNVDGSGLTPLTKDASEAWNPAWSPDGKKIAFESTSYHAEYHIYVMNADGSGLIRLTDDPGNDQHPTWSPDGRRIAFAADRTGNLTNYIYIMNADGSQQTRIMNNCDSNWDPDWSPDGKQIVFSCAFYSEKRMSLYVMNVDGSGETQLTHDQADDRSPAWSPDGASIAYESERDGNKQIYTINADGSGQTRLTGDDMDVGSPAWSPDGEWIATDGIYIIRVDDSQAIPITGDLLGQSPAWFAKGN